MSLNFISCAFTFKLDTKSNFIFIISKEPPHFKYDLKNIFQVFENNFSHIYFLMLSNVYYQNTYWQHKTSFGVNILQNIYGASIFFDNLYKMSKFNS